MSTNYVWRPVGIRDYRPVAIKARYRIVGPILVPWKLHGDVGPVTSARDAVGIAPGGADRVVEGVRRIESPVDRGHIPAGRRERLERRATVVRVVCHRGAAGVVTFQA